jgi:tight adherence protein B
MNNQGDARRVSRRRRALILTPSVLIVALVTTVAWAQRDDLHWLVQVDPALPTAVLACVTVLSGCLACALWLEEAAFRGLWLRRSSQVTGLASLAPPAAWQRLLRLVPDPLEWLTRPILRTRLGKRLADDWIDAGLGTKPSRYFVLLSLTAVGGYLLAVRIAGGVLGVAMAIALPYLPVRVIRGRAAAMRRRFGEQLPMGLDAIAAGLAAGLSFQQAVDFAVEELPQPIAGVLAKLSRRMALGHPVQEALRSLLQEHEEESLALAVEGVTLQRRFGGDMVRMLEETAELLRERVELEREVQAVTIQGRLSGSVIAALVPVSAGMLLAFNPRYIDVLFETLVGQILLVLALLLQLAGWLIISRLIRIRY